MLHTLHMDIITCLEPIYGSLLLPTVFVLITNSLSSLCVAGIAYAFWWKHKPFFPIIGLVVVTGVLTFGVKFVYGIKDAQTATVCCTAPLYTVVNHTFPSTHAAIVTVLVGQFLKPFFKTREQQQQHLLGGGGTDLIQVGKWEMVVRVFFMLIYMFLVCVSRVVLFTNDILDVSVGVCLGVTVLVLEFYTRRLLKPEQSYVKTE